MILYAWIKHIVVSPDYEMPMPLSNSYVANQLLIPAIVMFFLTWSLIGAAIGVGLIVCSAKMFRLFGVMNRYVSARRGLKPLEVAHDVGQSVRRHRRLIGTFIVLGSAYSLYGLVMWFDNSAIVSALHLDYPRAFVAWILESLRWILLLLSVLALLVGIMLGGFPAALGWFEAQANHWYSVRKATLGGDTMHLTLDKWVELFPRSAGLIIMITALYVAANAAILWLSMR